VDFEEIKEQWEELEVWKKVLITLFFSGVIVYIGYMFLIEPKLIQKATLEKEVKKLQNDINYLKKFATKEKLQKLNEKISSIKEQISKKEKELEVYKKYIPERAYTEKLLIYVSKISDKAGINLESFSVKGKNVVYAVYKKDLNRVVFKKKLSKGESGIKLNKMTFETKASGSIKSLYKFLNYLTKTKRIIIVDKVNISKSKGNLLFDIVFSSYYMED